jgi:DNA-binding NarL/FixJ family response regulator
MKKVRVLLADKFDIYRRGLQSIITERETFALKGSCTSGSELIDTFKKHPESVCITSSNIEDTNIHDLMVQLREFNPDVKVIVLTYSTDLSHLNQSIQAGVMGYLTKSATEPELIDALEKVAAGEQAFSSSVSQYMIGKFADQARKKSGKTVQKITKREKEILKLIVEGYTSSEIAKMLYISTRTVETHRANLMNKLEIKNTAALVRYALEEPEITL